MLLERVHRAVSPHNIVCRNGLHVFRALGQATGDGRYQAYADTAFTNNLGGFNFKQFRSNVVFRWEYRPGSTLFVVWSQGRRGSTGVEGAQGFRGDLSDLFDLRPDNSFLVKLSYWINR